VADRVLTDVTQAADEVAVAAHDTAVETTAEHVAAPPVAAVERLRKRLVNSLEAVRQVRARSPDEEVNMVRHEAERENAPVAAPDLLCDESQVALPIGVVVEQDQAVRALRGYVMDGSGELEARLAWHISSRPTSSDFAPWRQGVCPLSVM
jgi:hypothetical protein